MKKIAFFGHRIIVDACKVKRLIRQVLIEKVGQEKGEVLVGVHGDFDKIVLNECLSYKQEINKSLKITLVLTSMSSIGRNCLEKEKAYDTLIYDIEEKHYKNRITFTNKKVVEESDIVVCFVDMKQKVSGAKMAVKHAIKHDKEVINLYYSL